LSDRMLAYAMAIAFPDSFNTMKQALWLQKATYLDPQYPPPSKLSGPVANLMRISHNVFYSASSSRFRQRTSRFHSTPKSLHTKHHQVALYSASSSRVIHRIIILLPTVQPAQITIGKNEVVPATVSDTPQLHSVKLVDLLQAPALDRNLLSVNKSTMGHMWEFDEVKAYLRYKQDEYQLSDWTCPSSATLAIGSVTGHFLFVL
jgi:hypothetical protein